MIEIKASFSCEKYRFSNSAGDVIIGEAHDGTTFIAIKGPSEIDELQPGCSYAFYGSWSTYENRRTGRKEKQFHFQTFVESQPSTRDGVIGYLQNLGKGRGIGKARAAKLHDKFGNDTLRVIKDTPEIAAASIKGWPIEEAKTLASELKKKEGLETCTVELMELLNGWKFPKSITKNLIKEYGNQASSRIRRNPYLLMNYHGVGFRKADAFYIGLGLDPKRLKRQVMCGWYALESDSTGDTWKTAQFVASSIDGQVGHGANPIKAIKMAKRVKRMGAIETIRERQGAIVEAGGTVYCATKERAEQERKISQVVSRMASQTQQRWPNPFDIGGIDSHQASELEKALQGPISILGGSPGTGKTYTAAALITETIKKIGVANIAVAAPTGKAAVRVSESLAGYGLDLQARTWHSLLGVDAAGDGGSFSFRHNEGNPWDFKLIVGDESSMIDTSLMSHICKAIPKGCSLLLVGDVNQLPPVGHGAPFRDLINAGLPYGELTEIKRNSGGIVEACASIRDNEPWSCGDNLVMIESNSPDRQVEVLKELLRDLEQEGFDPIWDCQTLVAVNEKSPLSRHSINGILQLELNHNVPFKKNKCRFLVGDKVVNLKNAYFVDVDDRDEKHYVANGDIGEVVVVDEKTIVVQLKAPKRLVIVPRGESTESESGCTFDLAYGLSVHKAQGSEFPVAIILIDDYPGARMVCDRSWLYTAISRAKKRCYLIGKKAVADSMCKKQTIQGRKTFLKESILLNRSKLTLMEI